MNYDLVKIKEKYGEKMMYLCRWLFPTVLEEEGLLFNTLQANFAYSKFLYDDIFLLIDGFKNYIYKLIETELQKEEKIVTKTPKELLNEVGYELYECKTESDIQAFRKYYAPSEELCTFNGGRLNRCHVFFAVKKNVDQIIRTNFLNPQRQDEYGTSVISIQFTRGKPNILSIKNRYNHQVINPDATFSNDLENIVEGLTKSFEQEYNLNISENQTNKFDIPGYVKAGDGRFYKYNYEINNIYYCTDNIIIDNFEVVDKYTEKEKYIITDYFIIDLVNKQISLYDETIEDTFINELKDIRKIEITKNKKTKNKTLKVIFNGESKKDAIIEIDKYNRLISYTDDNIRNMENAFLKNNKYLKRLNLNSVLYIGSNCLSSNVYLEEINISKIIEIGDLFLYHNLCLKEINLPFVNKIGDCFLYLNSVMESIDFPNLSQIESGFLNNSTVKNINLPNVKEIGDYFLSRNRKIVKLDIPLVNKIGDDFLRENSILREINIPSIISIGSFFLGWNTRLRNFTAPNLLSVGGNFLASNIELENIVAPNLLSVGGNFLASNIDLENIETPNIEKVGDRFLQWNMKLKNIYFPKLKVVGDSFLKENTSLTEVNLESLEQVGNEFLVSNNCLEKLNLPRLKIVETDFLFHNNVLTSLVLPELYQVGNYFLYHNEILSELYAPNLTVVGKCFLFRNNMLENFDLSNLKTFEKDFCDSNRSVKAKVLSRKN